MDESGHRARAPAGMLRESSQRPSDVSTTRNGMKKCGRSSPIDTIVHALRGADHLGSLDYVAREVIKAEDIIDYTPKENIAERLANRFGASIGAGAVRALHSMGGMR